MYVDPIPSFSCCKFHRKCKLSFFTCWQPFFFLCSNQNLVWCRCFFLGIKGIVAGHGGSAQTTVFFSRCNYFLSLKWAKCLDASRPRQSGMDASKLLLQFDAQVLKELGGKGSSSTGRHFRLWEWEGRMDSPQETNEQREKKLSTRVWP